MIAKAFEYINSLSDGNQMIAGAISLWLMGTITYICREVPRQIYAVIRKHITTEFISTSQHESFHALLKWFEKKGYTKKFRRVKFSNGRYGDNKTIKSVGYGTHMIWFGWMPIWVTLNKEDSKSEMDKETIILTKIGRSHILFDELIKEIMKRADKTDRFEVYRASKGEWRYSCWQPKRDFDSVIMDEATEVELIETIDNFIKSEEWYVKHGIPYSLGILLYGPPGTGKSSIIKAVASYVDYDVYTVSATGVSMYPDILQDVRSRSITTIEDIDSCISANKRRKGVGKRKIQTDDTDALLESLIISSTSDLLNALDGIVAGHGRILIMTTNYPEKLDDAMLRPGRCDLKLEIGYFTMDMFRLFLKRFFSADEVEGALKGRKFTSDKLTGAVLQKAILAKTECIAIVEDHTERGGRNDE